MELMPLSFPVLNTQRLKLRKVTKADVAEIFFLRTDAAHNKFIRV